MLELRGFLEKVFVILCKNYLPSVCVWGALREHEQINETDLHMTEDD